MTMTHAPARPGPLLRVVHAIPFIGQIARDIARDQENIWYALVILLTILVLSVQTWGVVALSVAALGAVPVMFVLLILITLG